MPVRVLIVDDDASFRAMATALLTARGHRVVGEAGSLTEARLAVARLRPDAILLDVNLPDGDGLSLAAELGGDGGPRVLLTSSDAAGPPPKAVQRSGATAFVAKTDLVVTDLQPHIGGE